METSLLALKSRLSYSDWENEWSLLEQEVHNCVVYEENLKKTELLEESLKGIDDLGVFDRMVLLGIYRQYQTVPSKFDRFSEYTKQIKYQSEEINKVLSPPMTNGQIIGELEANINDAKSYLRMFEGKI
jgi:hypothetical protein